jgi:hypothetical protein
VPDDAAGTVGQAWHGTAIALAVALAMLAICWGRPLTDDVAWYLIATRDWLGGAPLYQMVIEVNPPLNFYYTVPAILIADAFGLSDTNGQYVLTAMLMFGSLAWCGAIIRSELVLSAPRQALLLAGIGIAMVVPALDSIGQREHTLVMLLMPWLLGQIAPGTPSARKDVPRAIVAAFGVCLKPYFVLFPIAVTLVRMAQTRSLKPILSPANVTFLVIGLAYVAYVIVVHPAYLFDVVPVATQIYGAYRAEPGLLVEAVYPRVLLLLFLAAVALRDREGRAAPGMLGAATLAGFACFVIQGTGFAYHLIPMSVFGMVTCLLFLVRARKIGLFIVAAAAVYAGFVTLGVRQGFPRHGAVNHLFHVSDKVGEFDSFMSLSGSLLAGPPVAMATNAEWVSRYPANWLVPGAINALATTDCTAEPARCAEMQEIADTNRSDNIADMLRTEPDLLIVDLNSEFFLEPYFDWLAFMAEDPAWAPVFAQYREVASTSRFVFYKRQP